MRRIAIAIGGLLVMGALAWAAYYYGRPSWEPSLPFQTVARSGPGEYQLGLAQYPIVPSGLPPGLLPTVHIVAEAEELDTIAPKVFPNNLGLVRELRQLDYGRSYAVLALLGQGNPSGEIIIHRISRRDDRVTLWAQFVIPEVQLQMVTYPFHLVTVSREGAWGSRIRFVLMDGYRPVAETIHLIPA